MIIFSVYFCTNIYIDIYKKRGYQSVCTAVWISYHFKIPGWLVDSESASCPCLQLQSAGVLKTQAHFFPTPAPPPPQSSLLKDISTFSLQSLAEHTEIVALNDQISRRFVCIETVQVPFRPLDGISIVRYPTAGFESTTIYCAATFIVFEPFNLFYLSAKYG